MFVPIGDAPNVDGYRPWVTWGLIAVNVAVYALLTLPLSSTAIDPTDPLFLEWARHLQLQGVIETADQAASLGSAYNLFTFVHGYKPGAPALDDLFASMFLHAGFAHLAGNMVFLWIFGDNVEHRLGHGAFALAYLLTGAIAALSFAAAAAGSMTPLIGASGAIMGVTGFYFVWFPYNRVRLMWVLFLLFPVFTLPAWMVLGGYLVFNDFLPVLQGARDGVAHLAHLGGFVSGLVAAELLRRRVEAAMATGSPAEQALKMAEELLDEGDAVRAYQWLRRAHRLDREGRVRDRVERLLARFPGMYAGRADG
jgi:membrane associated rhomboid family serine protease